MIVSEDPDVRPQDRCAIVVDDRLSIGLAANAAAVVALTLGVRQPRLVGPDLVDAAGIRHPGLCPIGIAVLAAPGDDLGALRARALARGVDVVDFPASGQQTTDYELFRARTAATPIEALRYVAVGLVGPRRDVGRLVGRLPLLR